MATKSGTNVAQSTSVIVETPEQELARLRAENAALRAQSVTTVVTVDKLPDNVHRWPSELSEYREKNWQLGIVTADYDDVPKGHYVAIPVSGGAQAVIFAYGRRVKRIVPKSHYRRVANDRDYLASKATNMVIAKHASNAPNTDVIDNAPLASAVIGKLREEVPADGDRSARVTLWLVLNGMLPDAEKIALAMGHAPNESKRQNVTARMYDSMGMTVTVAIRETVAMTAKHKACRVVLRVTAKPGRQVDLLELDRYLTAAFSVK